MRAVALHSTRCPECEQELRHFERLQDAVAAHISAMIDDVDLGQIWSGIAPRLESRAPSLARRLRAWWDEREFGWAVRGPAFAAVAVALLLALVVYQRIEVQPGPEVASRVDNSAVLDSVQSSGNSLALVTDEETNTTLLWIMDDGSGGSVEHAVDQWEGGK